MEDKVNYITLNNNFFVVIDGLRDFFHSFAKINKNVNKDFRKVPKVKRLKNFEFL